MKELDDFERRVSELLTEGDMERADPNEAAVRRLHPRWVIRIRAERDPVVEETVRYRQLAEEVDDRYDNVVSPTDS